MQVLVTGGAGFVGNHLVQRLLDIGNVAVRSFDNLSRGQFALRSRRAPECIEGDVRNVSELRRAMQGCEVVFHLAANARVMSCEQTPDEAYATNVTGTWNVVRAAMDSGVHTLVMASSREVYGEPLTLPVNESAPIKPKNVYGATKAAAEACCNWASLSLRIPILRLCNVFGPADTDRVIPRFVEAALNSRSFNIYGCNKIIDFVWIEPVVEAFVRAGLYSNVQGPINVGSGEGRPILEVAKRVIDLTCSTSALNVLPVREVEVSRFVADISRLRKELGVIIPPDPLNNLAWICKPSADALLHRAVSYAEIGQ